MKFIAASIFFFRVSSYDIATGNDLIEISNSSVERCEKACAYEDRCKGYVFNPANEKCWLKDTLSDFKKIKINTNTGIKIFEY